MIKLISVNGTEVLFESDMLQEKVEKRGEVITASVAEFYKCYFTRIVDVPKDIKVTYMTRYNFMELKKLHREINSSFEINDSEGLYFDKCYLKGDLDFERIRNLQTGEWFYTGTLTIGVR